MDLHVTWAPRHRISPDKVVVQNCAELAGEQQRNLFVVDWIDLAQDRYRRRALVNAVMNLWVP
jgi:hypothetical protein